MPLRKTIIGMILSAALAGCGGGYIMTIPDTVAAAGSQAPAAIRMQRHEFWFFRPAVKDAAVRMWIDPADQRAAYTHADGYAAASVPAPSQPGRYALTVSHQDIYGDEATAQGACYVLSVDRLTVLVDWKAVDGDAEAVVVARDLDRLAKAGVQIAYAAVEPASRPAEAHAWLESHGLPDGPVLCWGVKKTWSGNVSAVTGTLPTARRQLPALLIAAGPEDDLLIAARRLNMLAVQIGPRRSAGFTGSADWFELADRILAARDLLGERDFSSATADTIRRQIEGRPAVTIAPTAVRPVIVGAATRPGVSTVTPGSAGATSRSASATAAAISRPAPAAPTAAQPAPVSSAPPVSAAPSPFR
jgi:hypothetical protein